jgi:hypothetical protein
VSPLRGSPSPAALAHHGLRAGRPGGKGVRQRCGLGGGGLAVAASLPKYGEAMSRESGHPDGMRGRVRNPVGALRGGYPLHAPKAPALTRGDLATSGGKRRCTAGRLTNPPRSPPEVPPGRGEGTQGVPQPVRAPKEVTEASEKSEAP